MMDLMEESGICSYVGKVNMDRNSPDILCEASAEESLAATRQWLEDVRDRYQRTKPILTPRFIPSCTDELRESDSLQRNTDFRCSLTCQRTKVKSHGFRSFAPGAAAMETPTIRREPLAEKSKP